MLPSPESPQPVAAAPINPPGKLCASPSRPQTVRILPAATTGASKLPRLGTSPLRRLAGRHMAPKLRPHLHELPTTPCETSPCASNRRQLMAVVSHLHAHHPLIHPVLSLVGCTTRTDPKYHPQAAQALLQPPLPDHAPSVASIPPAKVGCLYKLPYPVPIHYCRHGTLRLCVTWTDNYFGARVAYRTSSACETLRGHLAAPHRSPCT